jgi:hypothetical protein
MTESQSLDISDKIRKRYSDLITWRDGAFDGFPTVGFLFSNSSLNEKRKTESLNSLAV